MLISDALTESTASTAGIESALGAMGPSMASSVSAANTVPFGSSACDTGESGVCAVGTDFSVVPAVQARNGWSAHIHGPWGSKTSKLAVSWSSRGGSASELELLNLVIEYGPSAGGGSDMFSA